MFLMVMVVIQMVVMISNGGDRSLDGDGGYGGDDTDADDADGKKTAS